MSQREAKPIGEDPVDFMARLEVAEFERYDAMRVIAELEGELRYFDKIGDEARCVQLRADIARRRQSFGGGS